MILSPGEYVTGRDLPPSLVAVAEHPPARDAADQFVGQSLEEVKKYVILATLEQANGNKSEAVLVLGITRVTLLNQLKKFKT